MIHWKYKVKAQDIEVWTCVRYNPRKYREVGKMSGKTEHTNYENPLQDAVNSSFFLRLNIRLLKAALVIGGGGAFLMGLIFRLLS